MTGLPTHPNPDLAVGEGNKQRWNRPPHRRAGFHGAHLVFRRSLTLRSAAVLELEDAPCAATAARVAETGLTAHPAFSALAVAEGTRLLHQSAAADFGPDRPHSIQSITKLHVHLLMGELIGSGRIDPEARIGALLPWIGAGYADARVGDALDMAIDNDFSEDYADPHAGCYAEEVALGWRLPPEGTAEPTLREFVAAIGAAGPDAAEGPPGFVRYKSANTDVLTLLLASACDLPARLGAIVEAAGYEGAFHVSLTREGLPAFSGGGCLSARDLVRFGLLMARGGRGADGGTVGDAAFTREALVRPAPAYGPSRPGVRYSRHLITNGRWFGHGGYGGQFLMVDPVRGRAAAFFSVLENEAGYDEAYMRGVIEGLAHVLEVSAGAV